MKQTSRIISTYSADVFGVASALYELGGMTIMHDPSGCNSTYSTHDEPRWYDIDSMIYISGLTEMDAIMGNDDKLICDIVDAANSLKPSFITLCGTPVPTMTGFDFKSVAKVIENKLNIPVFGIPTTGMNTYVHGVSLAFCELANRIVKDVDAKTKKPSVNILGLTPLDFSYKGHDITIENFVREAGYEIVSKWAMGSTLEDIENSGKAHLNLVVSSTGLEAAKILQKRFGTPFVIGCPIAGKFSKLLKDTMVSGNNCGTYRKDLTYIPEVLEKETNEVAIIGEGFTSMSLAKAIELETDLGAKVICTTETDENYLRKKDVKLYYEEDIQNELKGYKYIIADPLYKPICPNDSCFISLPSENFSGRLYREDIPDLAKEFTILKDF